MSNRLGFRQYLKQYVSVPNMYFQPPSNVKLEYPCTIYNLSRANTDHASNVPYHVSPIYDVILVDYDPDSKYVDELLSVPGGRLVRSYVADNLNHWVFQIHYTGTFPEINS